MDQLIPVINRLQDLLSTVGLHVTLDLPQLAVVGCQSVGKTSVLEALVGRDFLPRGTGIVTRRPLILQLRNTTKDQVVGPTIKAGSGGGGDKTAKEWGEFSHCPNKKFSDFAEIRREIQEDTERLCGASKGVSPEPICLKIFSPYVIDLTLIDLPGITKVPVGDQPLDVEARIKDMVLFYISKPNCIILAVTAANTDLANSDSLQLARQVDPSGNRTMGVITKMDCMDEGTDALDMINGKVYPLRQGYVGVVCRSQKDIQSGVTIRESIKNEEAFFKKHEAYRHIAAHCGTAYMARQLHRILMTHIREALPGLRDRVNAMLHEHEQEMADYGNDLSGGMLDHTQAGNVLLQLFTKFSRCFADCIEGRNNSNRHDIIDGAPLPAIVGGARIHYIFFDVFGAAVNQFDPFDGLTDHDIRTSIRNANGPKSPLFVPEAAFETLVKGQINKLLSPSLQCAELVHAELTKCLSVTIRSIPEFRRFDKLRARVYDVVRSVLASCLAPTKEMIRNLIRIETGYINTNHPDFIGGSRAISACSMAYSSESPRYALDPTAAAAGFHFSKGDPPMSAMDPPPSLSECGSTAPDGSQPPTVADPPPLEGGATASRSGIFGFWRGNSASNGASAIRCDDHSRHSDSEAPGPSPMSPRVNGGAGSAISVSGLAPTNPPQGSGGLLWSLGPLRSAAAATPMMGARLERDNSITSLSGVMPSGIRLAAPPAVVSVHSSQLSEKERIETDIIKSLIASYLNIVKRSISDLVPKAVMCFMVNTFGADMVLHRELVTQLYKEDLFSELLNEAPEIAQGRARCAEAIRILRQAAEVISQITNFNMSSPSSAVATSPRDHPGDPC